MTVEKFREKVAKQAEGATNAQLVHMFEKSAQEYQADVIIGKSTINKLKLDFERVYAFRQELLRRLG